MPEPTRQDRELTSEGFLIPTDKVFNELYIKVLGTGGFYDDSYTRIYLRHWRMGTNAIVPDALSYDTQGLHFEISADALDGQTSDDRIGVLRLRKGSVSLSPTSGGTLAAHVTYYTGSFATTVQLHSGEEELYSYTSKAGEIFFNDRLSATAEIPGAGRQTALQCSWSNWICLCDITAMEYAQYMPSSGAGGALGGENYQEGPEYNL